MKHSFTSKLDLAQAYFPFITPPAARKKLMELIHDNRSLLDSLRAIGFRPHVRELSPAQVELIMDYLGNPFS